MAPDSCASLTSIQMPLSQSSATITTMPPSSEDDLFYYSHTEFCTLNSGATLLPTTLAKDAARIPMAASLEGLLLLLLDAGRRIGRFACALRRRRILSARSNVTLPIWNPNAPDAYRVQKMRYAGYDDQTWIVQPLSTMLESDLTGDSG